MGNLDGPKYDDVQQVASNDTNDSNKIIELAHYVDNSIDRQIPEKRSIRNYKKIHRQLEDIKKQCKNDLACIDSIEKIDDIAKKYKNNFQVFSTIMNVVAALEEGVTDSDSAEELRKKITEVYEKKADELLSTMEYSRDSMGAVNTIKNLVYTILTFLSIEAAAADNIKSTQNSFSLIMNDSNPALRTELGRFALQGELSTDGEEKGIGASFRLGNDAVGAIPFVGLKENDVFTDKTAGVALYAASDKFYANLTGSRTDRDATDISGRADGNKTTVNGKLGWTPTRNLSAYVGSEWNRYSVDGHSEEDDLAATLGANYKINDDFNIGVDTKFGDDDTYAGARFTWNFDIGGKRSRYSKSSRRNSFQREQRNFNRQTAINNAVGGALNEATGMDDSDKFNKAKVEVAETFPEADITTSGPVVSGANTSDILADNGPLINITVTLSSPAGYTISTTSMTFTPQLAGTSETKNYIITNTSTGKSETKNVIVTWQ